MRTLIAAAMFAAALPAFAQQTPAAAAESRPYVDAALTFLKSFTHTNRTGEAGAQAWTELRTASGDKVAIKVAGKDLILDAAGSKSDAQLIRFSKISTWREGKDVKGIHIEEAEIRIGADQHKGKAKLAMSEKDGKWVVQTIEIE
jgi:hypothetical protein